MNKMIGTDRKINHVREQNAMSFSFLGFSASKW